MTQPALHRLKSRQLYRRLLVVMALASHVTVAVNQVLPSVNLPARLGSGALAAAFITFVLLALSTGFYRW